MKCKFPPREGFLPDLYWDIHVRFTLNVFREYGYTIDFDSNLNHQGGWYEVELDNELVLFDFSDSSVCGGYDPFKYSAVFKTHLNEAQPGVYPWSPVSFYDWKELESFQFRTKYNPDSEIILSNQVRYGNATDRRRWVQQDLETHFRNVDLTITEQHTWWGKFSKAKCFVAVPGFCNNMLDRGAIQAMFLGLPVVTTKIPEILPHWSSFIPGVHYLLVKDDYSDLIDVLKSPNQYEKISEEVKKKVMEIFTPNSLVKWSKDCINHQKQQ